MMTGKDHCHLTSSSSLTILKVPSNYGQPKPGVERGPDAILADGTLLKDISDLKRNDIRQWKNIDIIDLQMAYRENIDKIEDPPINNLKRPRSVGKACEILYEMTREEVKKGTFVLTLGGDHSIALGSIAGVESQHKDLAVLWIDAHSDIHTIFTSESGNLHGAPVSFLMAFNHPNDMDGFHWLKNFDGPILKPNKIAYIGLRDVDDDEKKILAEYNITCFCMHDVIQLGLSKCVDLALAAIDPNGTSPLHLSFDIDSLDPTVAPSTGTPVPGGLLEREGKYICERLFETNRLVSMDLVELNVSIGSELDAIETTRVARSIILSALGKNYLK